jgi:DNA repair exonuclease SbcCD ATPase subunit
VNDFKLVKVELHNFKAFKSKSINIESGNLSLLDGPNGFGKTTFFDALELLFTGKVERYNNWDKDVTNQRMNFGRHPLLNEKVSNVDKLFVEVKFRCNDKELILKREANASQLLNIRRLESAKFNLFEYVNSDWQKIDSPEKYIEFIFGDNYLKNYSVMHYIQQEDSTQILKSKDTTKQDKINHLFNVEVYQSKVSKIDEILKALGKLKGKAVITKKQDLEDEITTEKQQLSSLSNPIDYTRLIKELEHPWDKNEIPENLDVIKTWLEEKSDFSRLSSLVNNKKVFLDYRFNQKLKVNLSLLDKQGFETDKAITPLLQFGHRLAFIKEYTEQLALIKLAENYLHSTEKGLLASIKNGQALPSEKLYQECLKKSNRELLSTEIETLVVLNSSAGDLEKTLNNIKRLHTDLTLEHVSYTHQKGDGEKCPTCGHSWDSYEELVKQFQKQKLKIDETLTKISGDFTSKLKHVEDSYVQPIRTELTEYINSFNDKKPYLEKICKLSEQQVSFLTNLSNSYIKHDVEIKSYRSTGFDLDVSLGIEKLKAKITSLYRPIDFNLLEDDFDYLFQEVLDSREHVLEALEPEHVQLKRSFLRYQYALAQRKGLKQKEQELELQENKLKKVNEYHNKLKDLQKVYLDCIKKYISDVSQGIEILFHIYTGRLLQNYSQGLGLFIEHNGDKISFRERSDSQIDALFSMSSGQLSALSIAFTLALNHKYAQNNLLLIDDPVQTMDEINMSAFIDLLRYEFTDRQIFISTHEDHTSAYFRYKFSKAGLEKARINFMSLTRFKNND